MASQETTERHLLSGSSNCSRSEETCGKSGLDFDPGVRDRAYWLHVLERLATPVLKALAERRLLRDMPLESSGDGRGPFAGLEAFGRLMAGIAPWLALTGGPPEEAALRERMQGWYMEAIDAATGPDSPDRLNFSEGYQPLVDAAFLAQALLRAPEALWKPLGDRVRQQVVHALGETRRIRPHYNNWLLFSAAIEAFLYQAGEADWDAMRIDYALKQHESWYAGDGIYGDGPAYHADYYNSFVIQPMLLDILTAVGHRYPDWERMKVAVGKRAKRHAGQLERMISPEGTFPPLGRSLAYRCGVFHLLAQLAWLDQLPSSLSPAQVRCGLTAVMQRMLEAEGTFTADGWLTIGFCGHQPGIGEAYISTGSLYLCATVLLPLGLTPDHSFWQGEEAWTSRKAWSGEPFPIDEAIAD
ncbi:DUF2264 domain-containing protein [Paenibacillus dendritiformis]|uniref:DUF2264 domain-containing protein n=1 Tax=Paenibacillus dendritiformis TaxID=130049 RepID=UPI00248C3BCA|nr:DUF2264 domain-containing protein [Paenibacillus dendritiformis]WGU93900.1 DUF2264 domain-containing protein [Paenibacillus dendritiformis]